MKSTISKFAAVLGVTTVTLFNAQAVLLSPGSSIALPLEPGPIGGTLLASLSLPFTAPTFSGTLISKVWSGDTSNPFGGLTFTYEISNDTISPDPIDRFTLSSYAGFFTDASYAGGSILSAVVPTSVVRNPTGNQISFNFTGPFEGTLIQGASSPLLVIQTSSANYQNSVAGIINSSTANVATFAPLAVPEPASAALVVLGAVALALRRKP
ncbi:MAG: PEP-CTERM sorting domain-containing protein [Verrucomicrobiota bacterium]